VEVYSHRLKLGIRWKLMVIFTAPSIYPQGNSPRYPLYRRRGGSQSRYGNYGKEINLLSMPRIEYFQRMY
jgi:hypothetical protein